MLHLDRGQLQELALNKSRGVRIFQSRSGRHERVGHGGIPCFDVQTAERGACFLDCAREQLVSAFLRGI